MKKLFTILLSLSFFASFSQKLQDMPTFNGSKTGVWTLVFYESVPGNGVWQPAHRMLLTDVLNGYTTATKHTADSLTLKQQIDAITASLVTKTKHTTDSAFLKGLIDVNTAKRIASVTVTGTTTKTVTITFVDATSVAANYTDLQGSGSGAGTDSSDVVGFGISKTISGANRTYKADTAAHALATKDYVQFVLDTSAKKFNTLQFYEAGGVIYSYGSGGTPDSLRVLSSAPTTGNAWIDSTTGYLKTRDWVHSKIFTYKPADSTSFAGGGSGPANEVLSFTTALTYYGAGVYGGDGHGVATKKIAAGTDGAVYWKMDVDATLDALTLAHTGTDDDRFTSPGIGDGIFANGSISNGGRMWRIASVGYQEPYVPEHYILDQEIYGIQRISGIVSIFYASSPTGTRTVLYPLGTYAGDLFPHIQLQGGKIKVYGEGVE